MPDSPLYAYRLIKAYKDGKIQDSRDPVVIESSLTIRLNGKDYVTIACSPADAEELAVGYLVAEGLLKDQKDLKSLRIKDGKVWVETGPAPEEYYKLPSFIGTSMGPSKMGSNPLVPKSFHNQTIFYADHLLRLINELNEGSGTFKLTGGTHIAGLGYRDRLMVAYEDIGRHNAVDKTFGHAFLNQLPVEECCLVLSGRVAKEILIKAAHSRVPLVLSRSAPTSGSVEMAESLGMTIVGFARGDRFNVYTHPERVQVFK